MNTNYNYKDLIITIGTLYTFITETLPFIESIKSNGIVHFLYLYTRNSNEYQRVSNIVENTIESQITEISQTDQLDQDISLNDRINNFEILLHQYNQDLTNLRSEIYSRLNNLENNN